MPKVVSVEDNRKRICTGVIMFDKTIYMIEKYSILPKAFANIFVISTPNSLKSYKSSVLNTLPLEIVRTVLVSAIKNHC